MPEEHAIQSVLPSRVVLCDNEVAYRQAIEECARTGPKIADYGTAHRSLGHAPASDHVQVVAPADVFEHWKADMAVRVSGGMTVRELQARLFEAHQFLSLDADGDVTVAEAITHNVYGPLRLSHGTCRDLLLGLRYVDSSGQWVKVGGKTVKNVAGYDVTRLMVGSLNTLGLVADANLRTTAIPHQVTRLELHGLDVTKLDTAMTDLLTCDANPYYIEYALSPDRNVIGHIAYAGTSRGCEAQATGLKAWLTRNGLSPSDIHRSDTAYGDDAAGRSQRRHWQRQVPAHVKLIVPPASCGDLTKRLLASEPKIGDLNVFPAHGVIHIGAAWSADRACDAHSRMQELLQQIGGLCVWQRRPDDHSAIPPFSPPQGDWSVLGRIKLVMDPNGLFNPERFV